MSFFKSIFNAVCDAGSELLDKQQDYAEGFEGMSDYQLKQLYREMRAHPYNVGILNGIARNSALEQECVARGIVISNQGAERQRQYWQGRYSKMSSHALKREHQSIICKYRSYASGPARDDDSLLKASILKPQITALENIFRERGLST